MRRCGGERNRRNDRAHAVNERRRRGQAADHHGDGRKRQQRRGAGEHDGQRHDGVLFSRTPRPPLWLAALSVISSIPSASSADTSFIKESTLPRITPSLASMRWMVGSDRPDNSASLRWSMPSSARAARSCAAVIMYETSIITSVISILGFTMGKIRFQVFRNNPVIPTICGAVGGQD